MVFGPRHSRVLSGRELLSDADPFHLLLLTFMRLFPILSPPHLDAIALPQSPYHALKRRGLRRAKALKVSIYGYKYIHRYERYAWIPMAVIFFILLGVAGPHLSIVPTPPLNIAEVASFVSFGGAVYGFATGWSSYAADYNVKQPEETPASRVFLLTFLGVVIPCIVLEILGMALTTAYKGLGGGDLLASGAKPLGSFGTFFLVLLALSVVSNNIPNDYSLGLSMQVLGKSFQRINRAVWALIGAVIYVLIAVPAAANFNETLSNFLLLIAYWLGPWSIILILEHFVFRRGRYNVDDWNTRSRLPIGWAAIISLVIGLVGVLLGAAQVYYVGPIARLFNPPFGMDIGFELGLIFAGIAYFFLRNVELAQTGHRVVLSGWIEIPLLPSIVTWP